MALADAQTLAVRKLLSKAAYESTLTPGPPLPRSHPSPALAAKLHLECAHCYSTARALVKTPGSSRPVVRTTSPGKSKSIFGKFGKDKNKESTNVNDGQRDGGNGEVTPELRQYLSSELALHNALAHKWLGVNAGEGSEGGTAVGFLAWSKKELEELKNSGGPIGAVGMTDRDKDMREAWQVRSTEELQSVGEFLKGYKKMNDSVCCTTSGCLGHQVDVNRPLVDVSRCSTTRNASGIYTCRCCGSANPSLRTPDPGFWTGLRRIFKKADRRASFAQWRGGGRQCRKGVKSGDIRGCWGLLLKFSEGPGADRYLNRYGGLEHALYTIAYDTPNKHRSSVNYMTLQMASSEPRFRVGSQIKPPETAGRSP